MKREGTRCLSGQGRFIMISARCPIPGILLRTRPTGYNPHDALEFEESAQMIISHVTKGVEMARKNNLPGQVIDFADTSWHHRVQYFYKSHLKKYPE
jgi:cyclic-di-AMP phosphodiesterase PgpH